MTKKMKKAFTIIELLVAVALLAILMAISGLVFAAAVKAYRTAGAATEIAAKLSTLTNRLNRDFQSLPAAMPMAIWFEYDSGSGKRYDQIQFFSTGDTFESWKQWAYVNASGTLVTETLSGNTARVYYGHVNHVRINGATRTFYRKYNHSSYVNTAEQATEMILSRRAHLMTSLSMPLPFPSSFAAAFFPWAIVGGNLYSNDVFEYDNISLSDWTNILSDPANVNQYLSTCFANPSNETPPSNFGGRPGVDLTALDGQSLHMILAQGVGSFSIQLAYMSGGALYWWPSQDPNGDGIMTDSDFGPTKMNAAVSGSSTYFGYYMNFSVPSTLADWKNTIPYMSLLATSDSYPKALKFTFTLYDSNGVFKDGKTFTHIIYLND